MIGVIPYLPDIPRFDGSALCAETDPEVWFPEPGGSARLAKATCARCPVRLECAEWALDHAERHGIYGGLTPKERQRLLRRRNARRAA